MPKPNCSKPTPKVIQINSTECPVIFHKVEVPAAMGDDETNPPYPGQYRNVLLEYEANGHIWMFSSDGIPTFISNGRDQGTINYEELLNKPQINSVELIGDVSLEDLGITGLINDEATAREQADITLQNAIDAESATRSQADILLNEAISAEATAREAAIDAEESARIAADNDIISRIPVVNDATLTIQKNGATVATFTANDADNVTADIAVPTKTSDITNDSGFITNTVNDLTNYYTKTESDTALTNEATTRADADTNLQEQIDAISSSSDVVDVVGTYAELQAYDTSKLHDNDIVKVLTDETHDDAISYYRWDDANDTFDYIGSQGPFYTKSETDATFVPQTRTVNNKALSSNITLTAADVGALPDSTVIPTVNNAILHIQKNGTTVQTFTANQATNAVANITVPTKTSDLTNDSDFPVDANYVHTDNNYTTADKNKLAGIAAGAEVNVQSDWNESDNSSDAYIKNKPSIPDSTSDLVNDSGFITNSVNNLTNYYKKSETYTKTEVDGLIPTKTSDLTNDGADGTSTYVEADDLATVATSGSYNDLSNTPNLATVATSGSYNDLTNKPTIPAAQVNSDWNANSGVAQILNKPSLATVATSGSYNDLTDKPDISLVEMSYGESNAWAKFIAAYQAGKIVYCRASSNSNPATGTQGRKAFMAYVNNAENPTEVEFQYVRSVSTKTSSQPVDQVFVYKLTNASGGTWTVQTRDMAPKLAQGTNTTVSYSNGTYTISASQPTVPTKTSDLTNDGSDGTSTYVEADDLATVATSGSYNDLADKPSIPSGQIQSDWAQTNTSEVDFIKNKPTLATVATSGSYNDLSNKPTIPTVNNATLTIQKNGTNVQTFTANSSSNKTANIVVPTKTSDVTNDGADGTSTYVEADELATVATTGSYNDLSNKPTIPTVGNATLTIQKNGTSAGTFTANATSNKTINITVPTTAADVSALPASTKYGASIAVSINTTDYKVTTTLKDQDGNTLGTAQVIDLPLESVVVSGSYDSTNKKIILTLQNGNTIDIPVADLVAGLQSEITSTNKLASDLVDDTNQTHKFVTSAQITKLNGIATGAEVNQNAFSNVKVGSTTVAADAKTDTLELVAGSNVTLTPDATNDKVTIAATDTTYSDATTSAHGLMSAADKTKLNGIATGAEVNVQSDWNQTTTTADDYIKNKPSLATVATSGSYNDLSNKPTIPTVNNATLTIQKNGSTVKTFTANASSNVTANITVPTKTSDLTNDSNFATTTDLAAKVDVASINLTGQTTTILAQVQALAGTKNYARFICTSDGGSANISDNPNAGKGFVCVAYQSRGSSSSDYAYEVICYSNDGTSKPYYARVIHSTTSITWKRLQDVAFSGSYNDLSNKPTIPAAQVQSNWTQTTTTAVDYIKNKPTLATVATSGSYNDLSNKPTIPTVNNATLTIQKNGTNVQTFTANQSTNATANITVPTKTSDLTNDSNFVASGSLATVATSGSYNDLSNKPTIPTVNNATLTIQKNGSTVKTFTANASSNVTANITVPTKTSDITNDSDFTTNAIAQKFATQDSMAAPDFDGMTPLQTFTWSVSDTTYRAVYQMENTGWAYDNMDVAVAYRITVTGTSISQVVDVYERWYNPTSYPVTSAMCRTLSTSAATTGFRYLRAVYPTSSGLNNNTYKIGTEIANYNATARTIKVEVFKTATGVTWNATKPSGSIYSSSTYQANNAVQTYSNRGWIFRKAASFQATGADVATFINSYEPWSMSSSTLKAGAALTNGYLAYLATDGKVYMVTNTTQNMVPTDAGKIGLITTGYNADATIDYRYFRPLAAMSSTQVGYISHDTFTLGYPVYLRCTMDSSGNIHSGNYLTTSMAAGYTYVPIGVATATNTVALDARKPMFYTLDSSGKLSHVNGKAVAGTTYTAGAHINITGNTIKAIDYVHSDTPVSTSSVTPIVTNSMISDGTITFSKTATGEFLKLTLTTTDPGAGSALAANTLLGVYE